jgi:hypothetical protein
MARALAILILAGCSTRTDVHSYYDPAVKFEGFKVYAWLPREESGDPMIDDNLLEQRVRGAVESELAAKGYEKTTSGRPDFWVGYHTVLQPKTSVEKLNQVYPYYHAPGESDSFAPELHPTAGAGYSERSYDEGMLVLDVADAKERRLIWRASAQTEVNLKARSSKREKQVREAVKKMLARFPPGPER